MNSSRVVVCRRNSSRQPRGGQPTHGTGLLRELFALGFNQQKYWSTLADDLGVRFSEDLADATFIPDSETLAIDAVRTTTSILIRLANETILVTAPRQDEAALLRRRLQLNPPVGYRIWIASPETIRAFIVTHRHPALTHYALNRLAGVLPRLSAGRATGARRPKLLLAAAVSLALVAPVAALTAIGLFSTLFFVNCSFWKLAAAFRRRRPLRLEPVFDDRLPTYSVLVPLYREAAVVEDLIDHLGRIDYPAFCIKRTLVLLIQKAATTRSQSCKFC